MDRDAVIGLSSLEKAQPRLAPTGFEGKGNLDDAVRDLITTYHDLNPSTIDTLDTEPSPLEFMRYVASNRPFVVRKGASSWPALQRWNATYLRETLNKQPVNVATTPYGNADSVFELPASALLFAKPYETSAPFSDVLARIQDQELRSSSGSGSGSGSRSNPHPKEETGKDKGQDDDDDDDDDNNNEKEPPTHYLQTQNDNLRTEYLTLFSDVPASIPFANIALRSAPDAINFWLGNSHSVTALHKDNYENVYVQVCGQKHFVLLPPVEAACVNEKSVLAATYAPALGPDVEGQGGGSGVRAEEKGLSEGLPGVGARLVLRVDDPEEYVPFATWDPDRSDRNTTRFSQFSRPLRVTLEEGDMLYLPALWYHKVSQSCSEEGICCAVNYWYDLEFSGGFWSTAGFVRGVGLLAVQERERCGREQQRGCN